jgi:hypothetical protein
MAASNLTIADDDRAARGPQLFAGMTEEVMVTRMNTWGIAVEAHARLLAEDVDELRKTLGSTQAVVAATFEQARVTLFDMVQVFRNEGEQLRVMGQAETAQAMAHLEQVVQDARLKFDTQDAKFSANLGELASRLQAVDAWAQAEPGRMAAIVQAAPAQQARPTSFSPGGTPVSHYPPVTPQRGSGQDPFQGAADPWSGYGQGPKGDTRHFSLSTPGGGGQGSPAQGQPAAWARPAGTTNTSPLRVDHRSWGDHRKLDVATTNEGFQIWKDRALVFLSRERPDIRRLLTWAETQGKEGLEADLAAQAAQLGIGDIDAVEFVLHDGVKMIIQDSLLGRARNCIERGCELWRALCAEWSGAAPQLKHAKARRYQDPARCKDISELWSKLPAWERLGEEIKLAGLDLPEWLRSAALEKLLPAPLLGTLVSRSELNTYAARVTWVKTQMEHVRGMAQATAYGPAHKDSAGDVLMGSLAQPPGISAGGDGSREAVVWALHEEMARLEQNGEWDQAEPLQAAIQALSKGNKGGYNRAKGASKGGPKGAPSPGKGGAAGGSEFNGVCHHCGVWGHRRSDCRRLDNEMGAKGGGKGGKGPKGGAKGGKGPGILECAEETPREEEGEHEDYAGEEWWALGLGSLTLAESCAAKTPKAKAKLAPAPKKTARIEHDNQFAALALLLDGEEPVQALLGAVTGGTSRIVEAVVDSGAVHSVTPPSLFPGKITSSPWSRAGRSYRAANGTGIDNLGQVSVAFGTDAGHRCKIPFQVANVEQPLLSVAHLTAAGNRVELLAHEGRIVHISTGRTIMLEKRGGVYLLKMHVEGEGTPLPFPRQGA